MEPNKTESAEQYVPQPHDLASNVSPELAAEILHAIDGVSDLGDAVQTVYNRAEKDARVAGLLKAWSDQYGFEGHVHAERSLLRKIAADLNDRRVAARAESSTTANSQES